MLDRKVKHVILDSKLEIKQTGVEKMRYTMNDSYETLNNAPLNCNIPADYIDLRLSLIEATYGDIEAGQDNANSLFHRGDIKSWGEWFETVSMTMEALSE